MVHAILVDDESIGDRTQLEEAVPVLIRSRQPRCECRSGSALICRIPI
jgi:hypothetical protein